MRTEEEIKEKIKYFENLNNDFQDEDTQVGCHRLIDLLNWVLGDNK